MNIPLLIGKGAVVQALDPRYANRHGLIAGATGTGKTLSLQVLAEGFSALGVPVLAVDIKGDLSGIARAGIDSEKIQTRAARAGMESWTPQACPTVFWDVFGRRGHPLRATISDLGPLLLSRLLELSDVQASVLQLVFRYADDQGLLLLDLKDLRAMLQHAGEHARELTTQYGNVSSVSLGAIQRGLLQLEEQGGARFFGEPALQLHDLIQHAPDGQGLVHILAADRLLQSPRLYATFLLWLLSELFEELPEVGDLPQPKLVFFFDEAHLLFNEAPKALLEQIEQVVRLIRSKGVGVYFISQNPMDVPDLVRGQLGNRVQHALRAFTPQDQQAVKAAARTFRGNPALDVEQVITELGVGEALVSFLDEEGRPGMVERAWILPPRGRIGPIAPEERQTLIRQSFLYGRYEQTVDRESAYERLTRRVETMAEAPHKITVRAGAGGSDDAPRGRARENLGEAMAKSAARSIGSQIGRQLMRGVLGSLFGRRR